MAINLLAYCLLYEKRVNEVTIHNELEPYGVGVSFFLAGNGELKDKKYDHIDIKTKGRDQAYNYTLCLQKIIKKAKEHKLPMFLFLEDDATITDKFGDLFVRILNQSKDLLPHDRLMLGGNHVNGPFRQITDNIIKPFYSLDGHATIWYERAYDKILEIEPSCEHTVDGVIGEKQKRGEIVTYAANPSIIIQKPCWSFNEDRWDDKLGNYYL